VFYSLEPDLGFPNCLAATAPAGRLWQVRKQGHNVPSRVASRRRPPLGSCRDAVFANACGAWRCRVGGLFLRHEAFVGFRATLPAQKQARRPGRRKAAAAQGFLGRRRRRRLSPVSVASPNALLQVAVRCAFSEGAVGAGLAALPRCSLGSGAAGGVQRPPRLPYCGPVLGGDRRRRIARLEAEDLVQQRVVLQPASAQVTL